MATTRDRPVKETRFENKQLEALGVELMSLDQLRQRIPAEVLAMPERVSFFILIYITSGSGTHTIDFHAWPLVENDLLFVRPGQVQQWQSGSTYSAQLMLIEPSALPYWDELSSTKDGEILALQEWQTHLQLPETQASDMASSIHRLQKDLTVFNASKLDVALIRYGLLVLMLRIARWQRALIDSQKVRQHHLKTYHLFMRDLEKNFRANHSLKFYAERLGYSQSTLSRACLASEGRAAKLVIDSRVALEAQRMLVHSSYSIEAVAHYLGFTETTNFSKFFRRLVGITPAKFRQNRLGLGKARA
jgi:AraC-like DNA-binding protein